MLVKIVNPFFKIKGPQLYNGQDHGHTLNISALHIRKGKYGWLVALHNELVLAGSEQSLNP